MSEPRDVNDWERRYGGTIAPPIPVRQRSLARRLLAFVWGPPLVLIIAIFFARGCT